MEMSDVAINIADKLYNAADKMKEIGLAAKIQGMIKAEEAKKLELYHRLGKKYYELYKDAPASDLTDVTNLINECDKKIADYKQQLEEAKAKNATDEEEDAEFEELDKDVEEAAEDAQEEVAEGVSSETDDKVEENKESAESSEA